MKLKAIILPAFIAAFSFASFADVVTNETIISLLKKGYNSETIINHIEGQDEVQLASGIDALDALMEAGADQSLISYVQKKTKKDKEGKTGLYYWNVASGQPQKMNISPLEQKSSGMGGGFLGTAVGVAGTVAGAMAGSGTAIAGSWIAGDLLSSSGFKSDKLYIQGEHAKIRTNPNPVFRFTLPSDDNFNPTDWIEMWQGAIKSPNEFQLVRLEPKGKGNKVNRQFPAKLKWTTAGFSTSDTAIAKNLVEFEVRQLNNKVYEITFPNGLEPGEYAFFYRNATHPLFKDHLSAYDFTVE